ncbi:MAG: hypothetical protein FWE14_13090 [Lachnospiraceae bacterium]|nr:hypothetical protein [Lachnospiraceae bacterium]
MGVIEYCKIEQKFFVLESVDDGKISNNSYEKWATERIVKALRVGTFPKAMSVEA